jgi:hypothetical protein
MWWAQQGKEISKRAERGPSGKLLLLLGRAGYAACCFDGLTYVRTDGGGGGGGGNGNSSELKSHVA